MVEAMNAAQEWLIRPKKAAMARKPLVAIWYVLTRGETDRNASEEDLAW